MEQLEPSVRWELEEARRLHGADSLETLSAVSKYARLLENMGELGQAEPLYREELAGRQRVQGKRGSGCHEQFGVTADAAWQAGRGRGSAERGPRRLFARTGLGP